MRGMNSDIKAEVVSCWKPWGVWRGVWWGGGEWRLREEWGKSVEQSMRGSGAERSEGEGCCAVGHLFGMTEVHQAHMTLRRC